MLATLVRAGGAAILTVADAWLLAGCVSELSCATAATILIVVPDGNWGDGTVMMNFAPAWATRLWPVQVMEVVPRHPYLCRTATPTGWSGHLHVRQCGI